MKPTNQIEQLTIAMFDGNAAGSSGYNEYLNGYVNIFYGWGNTKHRLSRGAGSSNAWLTDQITATAAQQNNYYELEARWLDADKTEGDNLFGLVDGEIPGGLEARDGEYTSRTYLGFASWSNAEWRVDRVYVRKCASVEPVTEIGREFNKPAISTPMPTPQTTTFEYDDYNKLSEILSEVSGNSPRKILKNFMESLQKVLKPPCESLLESFISLPKLTKKLRRLILKNLTRHTLENSIFLSEILGLL